MPWLGDTDLREARGFVRGMAEARIADIRRRALPALARLLPADVLTWDLVEIATGAVRHASVPVGAEPPGAFEAIVRRVADHPLLRVQAVGRRRPAMRLSEVADSRRLAHSDVYGDLLHRCGVEYGIAIGMRGGRGEAVVVGFGRTEREFSERDRELLDLVSPGLEAALRTAAARERLARARAANPPPDTAFVLLGDDGAIERSSIDSERWLAEHFGPADHPGWLPAPLADWLALPPRPALVSEHGGRRLTVHLLPGHPHALLLEEEVASFRPDALRRLGLTARETEVLRTAAAIDGEAGIGAELFISAHAVRERLERIEAKLDVRTASAAVARALRESA